MKDFLPVIYAQELVEMVDFLPDHLQARAKQLAEEVLAYLDLHLALPEEEFGFPESQLVANGMELESARTVARAFREGKDLRAVAGEVSGVLQRTIERLEEHPGYGNGL